MTNYRHPQLSACANIFVVGAAKAATTAMCDYLARHPSIAVLDPKEPHYFSRVEVMPQNRPFFQSTRDPAGYEELCRRANAERIVDGSTSYLWDDGTAKRLAVEAPKESRGVIMLRDPVERAFAHFLNNRRDGLEQRSFQQAVSDELAGRETDWLTAYVDIGRYAHQIERYKGHLQGRFCVVFAEDLRTDPRTELQKVFALLGLDPRDASIEQHTSNVYRNPTGSFARSILRSGTARRLARRTVPRAVRRRAYSSMLKEGVKPTMASMVRGALEEEYRGEIRQLEDVVRRSVPVSWTVQSNRTRTA